MEDTYQKIMLSQEDGKKSEEKSMQILDQDLPTSARIDTQDISGNILTSSKKNKNVVVPVQGLSFKITKG